MRHLAGQSARQEARHLPQGQSTTGEEGQASWAESQVLPEVVKRGLVLEEIRRSGEMHDSSAGCVPEYHVQRSPQAALCIACIKVPTDSRHCLLLRAHLDSCLGCLHAQQLVFIHRRNSLFSPADDAVPCAGLQFAEAATATSLKLVILFCTRHESHSSPSFDHRSLWPARHS